MGGSSNCSTPPQRLVLSVFWIWAVLLDMQWNLTAVLTRISLMTQNVEHLLYAYLPSVNILLRCRLRSLAKVHFYKGEVKHRAETV